MATWPVRKAMNATAPQTMTAMPPARPSNPSMKFMHTVIMVIHRIVSGQAAQPVWISNHGPTENECSVAPEEHIAREATKRQKSLT